jgi:hypothetical protein
MVPITMQAVSKNAFVETAVFRAASKNGTVEAAGFRDISKIDAAH